MAMMKTRCTALAVLLTTALPMSAQQEFRYVNSPGGISNYALGFPVPMPRNSSTPVRGFRSYESLHTRHQDLMLLHEFVTGEVVGNTIKSREIWAYVLSDADSQTNNGGQESSVLVNGGIHAREWGTPELTTGIIEGYAENAGDQHLYDYLIDNVHFVVLPVNNVDGFLQTQRYPDRVWVGQDPRVPNLWPRDGRMRRKNMRGVDEVFETTEDHLLGIDLNRNNAPYWATTNSSSSDPEELVFHGPSAFSEPETQALLAAAELAMPSRLRWYEDAHAFSRLFFSKQTSNNRRNAIQSNLLGNFIRFHNFYSMENYNRTRTYVDDPDPPNVGIGTTSGYFATEYQIPSWTLEIEPLNSATEYGGLGTEHDGFILPNSEVPRLRKSMAITHAVLAYQMAGPPSIEAVRVRDSQGMPVLEQRWVYQGDDSREVAVTRMGTLVPGQTYELDIVFDKPMRWPDEDGMVRIAPGLNIQLAPDVELVANSQSLVLDTNAGNWLGDAPDYNRYRFDTFRVPFSLPADWDVQNAPTVAMAVDAQDFTKQSLDSNPATVVNWNNGHWTGYENTVGSAGDEGGTDASMSLNIGTTDTLAVSVDSAPVSESTVVSVTVNRAGEGNGAITAELSVSGTNIDEDDIYLPQSTVSWSDGDIAEKTVSVIILDDFDHEPDETAELTLQILSGSATVDTQTSQLVISASDAAESTIVISEALETADPENLSLEQQLRTAAFAARRADGPVTIDLPANATFQYADSVDKVGAANLALYRVSNSVTLHGNGSTIQRSSGAPAFRFLQVMSGTQLTIMDLTLENGLVAGSGNGGAIGGQGDILLENVTVRNSEARLGGAVYANGSSLIVNGAVFEDNHARHSGGGIYLSRGDAIVDGATLQSNTSDKRGGAIFITKPMTLRNSEVTGNSANWAGIEGKDNRRLTLENVTILDNQPANCAERLQILDEGGNTDSDGSCSP